MSGCPRRTLHARPHILRRPRRTRQELLCTLHRNSIPWNRRHRSGICCDRRSPPLGLLVLLHYLSVDGGVAWVQLSRQR